jgi:hypothetical protein
MNVLVIEWRCTCKVLSCDFTVMNNENIKVLPKQAFINSNIKDKVVIKMCKKTWNLKKKIPLETKYLSVFF